MSNRNVHRNQKRHAMLGRYRSLCVACRLSDSASTSRCWVVFAGYGFPFRPRLYVAEREILTIGIAGGTGENAKAVRLARLTIILKRSVDCAPSLKGTGASRPQWRSGEGKDV